MPTAVCVVVVISLWYQEKAENLCTSAISIVNNNVKPDFLQSRALSRELPLRDCVWPNHSSIEEIVETPSSRSIVTPQEPSLRVFLKHVHLRFEE